MIEDLYQQSQELRIETTKLGFDTLAIDRVFGGAWHRRTIFRFAITSVMAALVIGISIALSGYWAHTHAQEVKSKQPSQAGLDSAAVRSLLVVRRPGTANNARPIVVLGRSSYSKDIPESGDKVRLDILARELVRQAILIAARDELGLSTRDEVIDDDLVEVAGAQSGGAEVISFIRDDKWHTQVRKVGSDRADELFSRETPTASGEDLDSMRLIVAAETWSRRRLQKY